MSCIKISLFLSLWIPLFVLSGCTTEWKKGSSFNKMIQTKVIVEAPPQGKVYINNKYVGENPIQTTLDYEQKVDVKTRKVSYWVTQPGWSLFISIISLGIYIPFSLIPVDIETSLEPTEEYINNEFTIGVITPENIESKEKISCKGQASIQLKLPPPN